MLEQKRKHERQRNKLETPFTPGNQSVKDDARLFQHLASIPYVRGNGSNVWVFF